MKDTLTRVAVTSRSFSRHPQLRAELLAHFENVTFNDEGASLSGESLVHFLRGHDRAIVALETLDESVVSSLPELKVVAKYGVGYDKIDLTALDKRGIRFGWTGGVNRRSVSELTLGLMLSLLRRLPEASQAVKNGVFQQVRGRQLSDRTVGIVGCGHVGKDLVGLLKAFGCRILVCDILDLSDFCRANGVLQVSLPTLLQTCDVLTLHVPLDASTRGLIGREQLLMLPPSAILINTARGGLVDEQTLKELLMSGRLASAALDVFTCEPPEDSELLSLPNFLPTPHIGGSAEEAALAMGRAAIEGLDSAVEAKQFMSGGLNS